jgi:hypothetical protein
MTINKDGILDLQRVSNDENIANFFIAKRSGDIVAQLCRASSSG